MNIRLLFLVCCSGLAFTSLAQSLPSENAESSVRAVLDRQVAAWNDGNIEQFMEDYWKSDSLLFIGSEISNGWDAALARYKRSYPGKDGMGKLRFEIVRFNLLAADACLVTGKYFLTRKNDAPKGVFTVVFRKKSNRWVIVYDHSSAAGN